MKSKCTTDNLSNKFWYFNGKLHRVDGPAIERANGSNEWWINDASYTEDEFNIKMNPFSCEGREVEIDGVTYTLKMKK